MEKIVLNGRNAKKEFEIPDDILAPKEDTKQQLNMIESVLKKSLGESFPVNNVKVPVAVPSSSNSTPKRPLLSANMTSTSGTSSPTTSNTPKRRISDVLGNSPKAVTTPKPNQQIKQESKPLSSNVTIVLDSDSDDEQFDADMALAIELSKKQKLTETPSNSKASDPQKPKTEKVIPSVKEIVKTTKPITNSTPAKVSTPKPLTTTNSNSNWLRKAAPAPSPSTPHRPVASSSSSHPQTPSSSRLEAKPKVAEGPRLIANDMTVERKIEDYIDVVYAKGEAIKKYEASHPYNFFLTAIVDSPPTHKETLSITMQEILDKSLGDLESSVQINFMVDIGWLLAHYYFAGHE